MAAQISSVADAFVEAWRVEVLALKPAKRAKWKGTMINQTGNRSTVRYCPEGVTTCGETTHFLHKLSAQRKGSRDTELDWLPVFSFSARASLMNSQMEQDRTIVLATPPGVRPILTPDQCTESLLFTNDVAPMTGNDAALCAQISKQTDENATGNHRSRHHAIRIPTAGGEPVRG